MGSTFLRSCLSLCFFFFFNDTATTEIYTLSLHDALPICRRTEPRDVGEVLLRPDADVDAAGRADPPGIFRDARLVRDKVVRERSEEHTSELQSRQYLVCRLLLEKKKKNASTRIPTCCRTR